LELLGLAGEVHIPASVAAEIADYRKPWVAPSWIRVTSLADVQTNESTGWQQAGWLDIGEADAIALARQINADWLLTDDAAARLFAQTLGLEVHGSLGIVIWAAAVGHLKRREEAYAILEQLAHSSLWISSKVFAEAHKAITQMLRE